MHIISFKKLKDFFIKDVNARVGLQDWYKRSKKADWQNFSDIKKTFNSVDSNCPILVKKNFYTLGRES
jgi:mRNA interferase HigB